MKAAIAAVAALVVGGLALSLPASAAPSPVADAPLVGMVIALDPGHQLGNSNPAHFDELAATHFNGHERKICNTSGTATNAGFPEATFTWNVALKVKEKLEALGADVRMTRHSNSWKKWGPCVNERGAFGTKVGADLMLSIHADGADSSGYGFYVMVPSVIKGWTDDISAKSIRLGKRFVSGMAGSGAPRSTYVSGQMMITPTISTLNFSDVPVILLESGNMRHSADAARMSSSAGQQQYADWIVAGLRAALRK
ncbi:MAG: N-acetylmuramoyl-L-alanine amidase [Actinobacteria bacterium]|nr:N-acetylmuramoyl-L-alanine amidase [Actinomycetota bacterium]